MTILVYSHKKGMEYLTVRGWVTILFVFLDFSQG